ncbi:hypothetical protein T07_6094 [Trichinella nelsoni]|uniref:Uncharacterized protein n=1 Tax=Trichinella nelsoni TaxID=6336 RepID=A0A0V0SBI4_9BILA|nr:hypothetical protein T07_6094 [Trichinella nelsoni]
MIQFPLCCFQNQIGRVEIFSNNFMLLICTVRLMPTVDLSFSNLNILKSTFSFAARVVQYSYFYYNHSRPTIISTTIVPNTSLKMMYSTIAVLRPIDDRLYECGDKCIVRGAWIE